MSTLKNCNKMALMFLIALALCPDPAPAGQLASAGVVTLAANATIGNGTVSEGATVFSGDLLKTGDQGHLSVQSGSLQFVLGSNTSARVFRNLDRTIVELERGTLAYSARGVNENLAIFALDIRFVPQ